MRLRTLLVIATAALALSACKKSKDGKADLPPATGAGSEPLPDLPSMNPAPDAGAGATAAAADAEAKTTGSLVAHAQVTVGPKSSGTITAINFDEGDHVKKGDVLFRLDASDASLMRKSAQTSLEAAKLQLKTAQKAYDRIKSLVDQNAAPAAQLDQLEAQVSGAQLAIVQAKNQLALASKQISDATVRSPMSGIVLKKIATVGEYATMMPPSPVLVLQDQATLDLEFDLPERSLAAVHIHDKITVTIPALGVTRTAEITEISPMVNPVTRTLTFTAALDNKDGTLKPGLMAEISKDAAPEAPPPTPEPAPATEPAPKTPPPAAKKAPVTPTKAPPKKGAPKTYAPKKSGPTPATKAVVP